ncbi:C2 domain-containing protein [Hordeum vulgare]|nr:C2 domain-containing protein [Hordeum vulgare]
MKRREGRHAKERKLKDGEAATLAAAARQEETNAIGIAATRDALIYLGLNPSQHGLTAAMTAASICSSAFSRAPLPKLMRTSTAPAMVGFHHHYLHVSPFYGECLPEAFHALEAFKAQHEKSFNLVHCWMVINSGKKFRAQYAAAKARGGTEVVEKHGEEEIPQPRGNTNSEKEDKHDVASIALYATLEGMMSKKDTRKEKCRQDKEEQMNAFMKIQRKRLELDAKKQAKRLEMKAENQAKMLEIEAANAKTKANEVAFASMMTCVEIMKVDLSTVSLTKRSWFEKMQADMLKFDDE